MSSRPMPTSMPSALAASAVPDSCAALTRYLIESGLLDPAAIVGGRLRMRDCSRRNLNLAVDGAGSAGLFVKIGTDPARRTGLAHEAAAYRRLHGRLAAAHATRMLPPLVRHDPAAAVLVLGQADRENLRELHARLGRFVPVLAIRLGTELGRLHRIPSDGPQGDDVAEGFYPLPFCLARPLPGFVANCSAASLDFMRLVGGNDRLCVALTLLAASWKERAVRRACLVHGDLRLDNCCVHLRPLRLRLVDWELAHHGDPAWDVGAVVADYLSTWLASMPLPPGGDPADCMRLSGIAYAAMQAAVKAFFTAYARARGLAGPDWAAELHACVRHAAARLLQLAFEQLQVAARLTTHALVHLQLSENLLCRPEEGAALFLGIRP